MGVLGYNLETLTATDQKKHQKRLLDLLQEEEERTAHQSESLDPELPDLRANTSNSPLPPHQLQQWLNLSGTLLFLATKWWPLSTGPWENPVLHLAALFSELLG